VERGREREREREEKETQEEEAEAEQGSIHLAVAGVSLAAGLAAAWLQSLLLPPYIRIAAAAIAKAACCLAASLFWGSGCNWRWLLYIVLLPIGSSVVCSRGSYTAHAAEEKRELAHYTYTLRIHTELLFWTSCREPDAERLELHFGGFLVHARNVCDAVKSVK
jgi:hypothetical protein